MWPKIYEIVEDDDFLAQVEALTGSVKRWDEIMGASHAELASNPHIGHIVPRTMIPAASLETDPPLTLYYYINEDDFIVVFLEVYKV